MQRLICPNCGYANSSFKGSLIVVIETEVTVVVDSHGKPKPALGRRVNMQKGKLGESPVVECPNCGEEFKAMDIVKFGCSVCGVEIAQEDIKDHFCRSSLDLRCFEHMDTYYCEGCSYAGECELCKNIRSR